jgi:predicted ATPase
VFLKSLDIETFKSYEDQTAPLGSFRLLVGPNGGGKTSVLQAIEFFGALSRGTLRDELELRDWEYKDLPWLRGETRRFGFTAHLELDEAHISWLLRFGHRRRPGIDAEEVILNNETTLLSRSGRSMWRLDRSSGEKEAVQQTLTSSWLATIEKADRTRFPELLAVVEWARRIQRYVTLDPAILRAPSRRSTEGLGPRGEDLAGFLRWLRDDRPAQFDSMLTRVKDRYPSLQQVILKTAGFGWFRLSIDERWGDSSVRLSAPQVSDGLLRLIAISAMHELPEPPSVVMIDEIENGLHPYLLGQVIEMLEELAAETNIQIVATTHSPIAVNFVKDPRQVLVVSRDGQGKSVLKPLDETRGYARLGEHLEPGELWYNLGEQGLLGSGR